MTPDQIAKAILNDTVNADGKVLDMKKLHGLIAQAVRDAREGR